MRHRQPTKHDTQAPTGPKSIQHRTGFRWDAVNRGNGFEAKVLLMLNKSKERVAVVSRRSGDM